MANNTWTMNDTQKAFIEILKGYPNGATLKDIELDTGKIFKTGAINPLISKGYITATEGTTVVNLVYRDTVIGSVTKSWKVYQLVNKD